MTDTLEEVFSNVATFHNLLRIRTQRRETAYQEMIESRERIDALEKEIIATKERKVKIMQEAQSAIKKAYKLLIKKNVLLQKIFAVRGLENQKKTIQLEHDATIKDLTKQKQKEHIVCQEKHTHFLKCTRKEEAMDHVFSEEKSYHGILLEKKEDQEMEEAFEGVLAVRRIASLQKTHLEKTRLRMAMS